MSLIRTSARRTTVLLTAAVATLLATSGVAVADNIQDSIEASGAVTLEAGSATGGTASIRVVGNNSDGTTTDQGCNWDTGEQPLKLDVVTPAGVTATPDPLEITACGTDVTVTFKANASAVSGIATVSIVSAPAGGGGYNNQVSIPITVNAPPPPANTEPTVVVAGVTDGASYDKGEVPAATCDVTDAEDGPSSFPATLSAITGQYASDGIGSQTASCSYTDEGTPGLTDSDSKTYSIVDPSPPVISYSLNPDPADGSNGWYKGNVTLAWTVTEPQSPNSLQMTGCVDENITADQAATTYTCSATSAGGSAVEQSVTIRRDGTAPTISSNLSSVGTKNTAGWYNEPVTVGFTCLDGLSGVATCTAASVLQEGADQSVTGTATDDAGNSASTTVSDIDIDLTDPTAPTFNGGPAAGSSSYYGSVPAAPTSCSSSDGLSGLKSCEVSGYSTAVGTHTMTATATDNAGNTSTATRTYTVLAWNLNGFYSPVDMGGVWNSAKGGQTIPLKFEVFAGSTELTDVSLVTISLRKVTCPSSTVVVDAIEELVNTGGTNLRYDSVGGQFIQNWKTPTGAGCYTATMTADDGSSFSANFKMAK